MMVKICHITQRQAPLLVLAGNNAAAAFTHHPATPEEIRQTDALNAQSLENAGAAQAPVRRASCRPTAAAGQTAAADQTAARARRGLQLNQRRQRAHR